MVEDVHGRIWVNYLDATLSYVDNDTLRRWPYNSIIDSLQGKFAFSGDFEIDTDGTLWIALTNLGFLIIKQNGSYQLTPMPDKNTLLLTKAHEQDIIVYVGVQLPEKTSINENLARWKEDGMVTFDVIQFNKSPNTNSSSPQVCLLHDGITLLSHLGNFFILKDDSVTWQGEKNIVPEFIQKAPDGSIILGSIGKNNPGLLRYASQHHFIHEDFTNLLPGKAVSHFLNDHEGGWWATTLDAGVFYCKNPNLEIIDLFGDQSKSNVVALTSDSKETIYASLHDGSIYSIQPSLTKEILFPKQQENEGSGFDFLLYDTLTNRLWAGPNLTFWENNSWETVLSDEYPDNGIPAKSINLDVTGTSYWADSPNGFFAVSRIGNAGERFLKMKGIGQRTFSVTQDYAGNIWVTTMMGLNIWENGTLEFPSFDQPELYRQARDVKILPDQSMVILIHGGGILIRDHQGRITPVTVSEGLTTNTISGIDISADGVIYARSGSGLHVIKKQTDGLWKVETISIKNGLPSNQINAITFLKDELWIATNNGLARLKTKQQTFIMPSPQLDNFQVNNQDRVYTSGINLNHKENNITITFFALHYRSGGDITYRYRLMDNDSSWSITRLPEINFASLSPAKYMLEIQAQNEAGEWSKSAVWIFQINQAWWQTFWFRVGIAMALLCAGWWYIKSRLRETQLEIAHKDQIRELQASALRAQMNPHFIFNCLSSIQQFIVQNDQQSASRYLARFARLIRLALHGSVEGKHTLKSEMEMLENYLLLEQLRFRNKFKFKLTTEQTIQPDEIYLPPMLIQPLVENSILHGLRNKVNNGFIEIKFSMKSDDLQVVVIDNGIGFPDTSQQKDKKHHISIGTNLTEKRLIILSNNTQKETVSRSNILNEKSEVIGAQVTILITTSFDH